MEDILTTITKQFLPQMKPEERRRAIASLQAIIDSELLDLAKQGIDPNEIEVCPHCGSPYHTKRGFDSYGNQRYLCSGCARTFTARTRKIFATTKLPRKTWMRFVECHVDTLSLRQTAARCKVSLKTAFFMRHRVLEATKKTLPSFQVESGCGVELDECFIAESFKGNHANSEIKIPRKARKRTSGKDINEQICILTGINDAGNIFYEIAGRGSLTADCAASLLADKLAQGAIVSTDKAHVYPTALKTLKIAGHIASAQKEHGINRVNNLHRNLKEFITHFHGVATRRLDNYLAWFKWLWTFKVRRGAEQLANLVVVQAAKKTYETTWRSYKFTPSPFYEWWHKQAKWDSEIRYRLYGTS